jgi:hypothetical protein
LAAAITSFVIRPALTHKPQARARLRASAASTPPSASSLEQDQRFFGERFQRDPPSPGRAVPGREHDVLGHGE